jgi:hypothetical protein
MEISANASPSVASDMMESEEISGLVSSGKDSESFLKQEKSENALGKVFTPMPLSNERLLEFNVSLSYQCLDLVLTRKELIQFISKYGYLESSSAVNSQSPYMVAKIHVVSSKLYEALIDLDKLGNLLSEDIATTDHTEGMAWQKRETMRESLRSTRRKVANSQIGAGARNWQAVEESLSNSEDQLDLAEHETWKINDKVKWATINVTFTTPVPSDIVEVPPYKNAFIGLLNLFLSATYYLIWILPVILVLGAVYYFGKRFYLKIKG